MRHGALHCRQIAFRYGEVGVNRIQALNYQKRAAVRRDHVSQIDESSSGPPVNRRPDGAVIEIETGVLYCCFVLFNLGLGHRHRIFLRVIILPRNGPLISNAGNAIKIDLCQIQRCLRLAQIGLR